MTTYKAAGVDVGAAEESVRRISPLVSSTFSEGVLEGLGGFGSLFQPNFSDISNPVLVSSTDGVGTKTQIARRLGDFTTIGYDLVAMCVDDIACVGARPLFFLDYLAVGEQVPSAIEAVVGSIARACAECGCSLIGGETAEHPGVMAKDDIDLAGFVVGVGSKEALWGKAKVRAGDVLVGLGSPNLRSNGFSLVRTIYAKLLEPKSTLSKDETDWLRTLLEPSVLYSPLLSSLSAHDQIHAGVHVTGGGLLANLERVIPDHLLAEVARGRWDVPDVFRKIARDGDIALEEMERTFNMGIGLIVLVEESLADELVAGCSDRQVPAYVIGRVRERSNGEMERTKWIQ